MYNWTPRDLPVLASLYLQNEECFFVRRCVQRFLAGELTAREAIERIRSHPGVVDEDPDPAD
ncbi:MAG: hypothetical protein OXQ89_22815 [Rhodospirillaceae bacterium]|nr:hypothetical protein [Rhodospirillaceae bacterium]MDE0363780.1 hypothetical protein [Rhodospirillaceae bacterium]